MIERGIVFSILVTLFGVNSVLSSNINVTFTCDNSSHVLLPKANLTNFRLLQTDNNYCTPKTEDFNNCIVQNNSSIKVMYTTEKDTNLATSKEKKYYQLSCVDTKKEVKVAAANFEVFPTQNTYSPQTVAVPQSVSMVIKKNGTTFSNKVNIGDKLELEIKGPSNHVLGVKDCSASDGVLNHDVCNIPAAPAYGVYISQLISRLHKLLKVIGEKWENSTMADILKNDLYAFRFFNSTKVTITCLVNVCPMSDTSCYDEMQQCTSGKRRKRSEDLETRKETYETHVASVSFDVRTSFEPANSATGLYTVGIWKALSVLVMFYLQI